MTSSSVWFSVGTVEERKNRIVCFSIEFELERNKNTSMQWAKFNNDSETWKCMQTFRKTIQWLYDVSNNDVNPHVPNGNKCDIYWGEIMNIMMKYWCDRAHLSLYGIDLEMSTDMKSWHHCWVYSEPLSHSPTEQQHSRSFFWWRNGKWTKKIIFRLFVTFAWVE